MPSIVVGTAGHIDHGKSALVRALTGIDPDRLKEEQVRGITIDLGFAHLVEGDVTVAFVDVPGHERFVRNMLAGAAGIDAVLLVVAADESVMPQTREHFHICRLLGVSRGLVALTKADLADSEMRTLAALEVAELTVGSFLEGAPMIAVSARSGEGLPELRAALLALAREGSRASAARAARLPVDRAFSARGFGTVVTGTLTTGQLSIDQELALLPGDRRVRVRGLQVHGAAALSATAGQRVAVNLASVDLKDVARGVTLADPETLLTSRLLDVALELLPGVPPLRHGARIRVHQGTGEAVGRVSLTARRVDLAPIGELPPGGEAYARLRLERPLAVTRGDRFIIRSYSPLTTVGGGVVLDPHPLRVGVRTDAGRERLRKKDLTAREEDIVRRLLLERGPHGVHALTLVARLGLSPAAASQWIGALRADGSAVAAGAVIVSVEWANLLREAVLSAVDRHHREAPLSDGLSREEIRARLFARMPPQLFEIVVEGLIADRVLAGRDRLARAGRSVEMSEADAARLAALESAVLACGLEASDDRGVAAAAGVPQAEAERLIRVLVQRGAVVRLGTLLFHKQALGRLVEDVRGLREQGGASVDVGGFKTRYGLTRKYAMPLLEYLDRERVTRRVGDRRVIL